ncbi:MAG: hypothetical protein IH600_09980 [Bacteroidetes bacterium]|nr:hypothetical protein [Bacteroidota bacterium]
MPARCLAAVLLLALLWVGNTHGQETGEEMASGMRQRRMHNRYPFLFSPVAGETPAFGFFLRRYDGEGERGAANDVSYLGWNPLGLDTTSGGIWLNFENDYHGWFEHNLDVRTARGAFVRRMKTAIDRNDGQGVSMSWAYDHFTFHHGGAAAGGDSPQVDLTLDRSPDFTMLNVAGQVRTSRRMFADAAQLKGSGEMVIDWKSSNVIDVRIEGPTEVSFRNADPGQLLTIVLRNPGAYTVHWPGELLWPEGMKPPRPAPLLSLHFLAIQGMILAEAPTVYNASGSTHAGDR